MLPAAHVLTVKHPLPQGRSQTPLYASNPLLFVDMGHGVAQAHLSLDFQVGI